MKEITGTARTVRILYMPGAVRQGHDPNSLPGQQATRSEKECAMDDGGKLILMLVIVFVICIFGAWWLNQGGGPE